MNGIAQNVENFLMWNGLFNDGHLFESFATVIKESACLLV
jgi:hypothetical protein